MKNIEKKMIIIGLNILKNNPEYIITNVENNIESVQNLIEEGERLLKDEDISNTNITSEDLNEIMDIMKGKKEL